MRRSNSTSYQQQLIGWFSIFSLFLLVRCSDPQEKQLFGVWTLQENSDTKLAQGAFRILDLTEATVGFNKVTVTGSGAISLQGNHSPCSGIQRKIEEGEMKPSSYPYRRSLPPAPEATDFEVESHSQFNNTIPGSYTNPALVTEVQAKLANRQVKITHQGNNGALLEVLDCGSGDVVETRFLELSSDKSTLTVCGEFLFAFKSCHRYK